tara:strand:- start:1701 stop:2006 length:306 start_codon:yes stop_codon:yes gene_type:complete
MQTTTIENPIYARGYLNVYRIERCYGGPEEGGWYWDSWDCVATVGIDFLTLDEADQLHDLLVKQYPDSDTPLHSVLSDGTFTVSFEDKVAEMQTKEIPHYC